jgi:leucyl aminopeptidase
MIELSTLTYSVINALGASFAGIFGNSPSFNATLQAIGESVSERGWVLPLED